MEWSSAAFVFPGQGSQTVGMGKDFADVYSIALETFQHADEILGFSLSQLCFEGPENVLNDTINTQPALYTCSMAILRVLQAEIPSARPAFVAGHSLGEVIALAAAGALTFEDGLRLVRERGRLMKRAGEDHPGAMAAVLGLDTEIIASSCQTATALVGKPVILANDNCPGQIVISGDNDALEKAMELVQTAGARRVVKLDVSIAAHSPLMASASADFRKALDSTAISKPDFPVYANITTEPLMSVSSIRDELDHQLTQSVRWTESIQRMIADGANAFIEIGSGDVLTGLIKRIDRETTRIALNSVSELQKLLAG
jgi:[acyl-carrier-protein] S-malonyltransferase